MLLVYISTLQANWMGASPDGLVTDPSESQPYGLVEIKCPARAEKITLLDLCTNKKYKSSFFLQYTNGKYQLKKGNNYYYQIQGQLQITCRRWCDFVVWTALATVDDLVVQRIYLDEDMWKNTIYPCLYRFYMGSMLPELASPRHISGQPVREAAPFWNDDDLQLSTSVQPSQD